MMSGPRPRAIAPLDPDRWPNSLEEYKVQYFNPNAYDAAQNFPEGSPDSEATPPFSVDNVRFYSDAGCGGENGADEVFKKYDVTDLWTDRTKVFCSDDSDFTSALGVKVKGEIGNCQIHFYGDGADSCSINSDGDVVMGNCGPERWLGYMTVAEQAEGCMNPVDVMGLPVQNIKAFAFRCPPGSPGSN